MAPKALLLLPLLSSVTFAWGSNQDLYVRDSIPDLDPYAVEAALRRRALIARQVKSAKAKRSAERIVMARQLKPRKAAPAPAPEAVPEPEPVAEADPEDHSFQQYDAGLYRRDGSVRPRDPYAEPTPEFYTDPETWFEGGELYAKRGRIINAKRAVLREKRKRSLFAKRAEIAAREAEAEAAANANPEAVAAAEAVVEAEAMVEKRSDNSWFSWLKLW